MLNPDYRDILSALSEEGVEFLIVGAFALAAHGLPRATGDIDIWVRNSDENATRVWQALVRFGAPLRGLAPSDLAAPDIVFQIGVAPRRIDILTSVDGVVFDEAWPYRLTVSLEGVAIPVIGRAHLIQNKRAAGRPKDLADLDWLQNAP
ncbi:MAG: hypothetical protein AB7R89_14500 [Dehalococcoidia bacterium]